MEGANNDDLTNTQAQLNIVKEFIKGEQDAAISSPWIPFGILRRGVFIACLLFSFYGFFFEAYSLCWVSLLAILMSPRIVGKAVIVISSIAQK